MNGGSGADFMIHGIVKYHLFGHELWLTTTTVGMTIVTIVLQPEWSVRPENGYCRLWCYVPSWSGHVCDRTVSGNQKSWCRTLYGTVSTSPGAVPDQSDR